MAEQLPPPPYPADTRAKGWRFELDHERIRQSDTWALASAEVRPWLLMLWMVAWEQTPCGSLPAEDDLIAARIGMPVKAFGKHRAILMRGWWPADDGRLYHDTMAQRVAEMVESRRKNAKRVADWKAAQREQRAGNALPTRQQQGENDTGTGTGTGTISESSIPRKSPPASPRRPRASKAPATPIPDDFGISDGVRQWAAKNGFLRLDEHLEAFILKAKAKSYTYADWDAAFKSAIREDWGKVRSGGANGRGAPAGEAATRPSGEAEATQRLLEEQRLTPEQYEASKRAKALVFGAVKVIGKAA